MAFSFVLICTFSLPALAQTDSLQYSEETAQDSMVQYLTPLEYAFMMHEETPWMVKINLVLINAFVNINANAFFEGKIGTAFTLSGGVTIKSIFSSTINIESTRLQTSLMIEPRWYYSMTKRIKAGKAKSNMSGNYLAFGVGLGNEFIKKYDYSLGTIINDPLIKENLFLTTIYAKWGMQRRFLKKGYVDFGVEASYEFYPADNQTSLFALSTFVNAGLAFAKDKEKLDGDKLCSVLRCYAADRFLFKANLASFLSVGISKDMFSYSFNPQFAFELKLGKSPFSLNADVKIQTREGDFLQPDLEQNFTLYTALDSRWYYNLKRRMLKGKTGNGLSANYFSFGLSYRLEKFAIRSDLINPIFPQRKFTYYDAGIQFLTGIQRTYAKHFYFDVNIGIRFLTDLDEYGFDPYSEFSALFAIGYRL